MPATPALRRALTVTAALALVLGAAPALAQQPTADTGAAGPAPLPPGGPRATYERSLGQPAHVYQPPGTLGHRWAGTPSYVANRAAYSRGELILSDTPFDDSGADTAPGNGIDQSRAQTAATLPGVCQTANGVPVDPARNGDGTNDSDPGYGGSADLVEVRLAADADSVWAVFVLQTMTRPDATVVGLGLTGAGEAPGSGAGLARSAHQLQVAPTGATLDGKAVPSRVDPDANTLQVRLPRRALPAGPWQVAAAAGTWTGTGWGSVMDLAHVPDEPLVGTPNCWFELQQSHDLATGQWPTATVDPRLLAKGYTAPPTVPRGPSVRMYYPRAHFGEGVAPQSRYAQDAVAKVYRGLLQPYSLYVPDSYDPRRPNPLVELLHCLNCTHDVYLDSSWPTLRTLAEDRGAPIATPLAYGEGGHYEGEAEWDAFEVLSDVSARFRVDRSRLYLAGMSMGALGTFRLGLLYPDLWARTFSVGNYTTPFCVTPLPSAPSCVLPFNYYDLLGNARNLAYGLVNGGADELTPVTQSTQITQRLDALGYPWRFWLFPARTHDPSLTGQTSDLTSAWLGDTRRVTQPQRVTFRRLAATEDAAYGLVHDRAYWLSGIALAPGAAVGDVDATSGRGWTYTRTPVSGSGSDAAGSYVVSGQDPVPSQVAGPNAVALVSSGVSALVLDPRGAGLCRREAVDLDVTTDVPLTVTVPGLGVVRAVPGTHTYRLPGAGSAC